MRWITVRVVLLLIMLSSLLVGLGFMVLGVASDGHSANPGKGRRFFFHHFPVVK